MSSVRPPPSRARPPTPSPSPRAKASQDPLGDAASKHGGGESHGGVEAPTPPPVAGASLAHPPTRRPPLPSSSPRVKISEDPTKLWEVKKLLEKETSSLEPVIVSMVTEMKKKFKKYWDLSYLKICIPVVLDPRFKLEFLDFRLKKGLGNMAGTYLSKIEQTFRELFEEYSLETNDLVCKNTKSNSKDVIIVDDNDPWADWGHVQNVQQTKKIDELEQYLSEETVPVTASFNILEHWKVYASKYPTLARMARDIHAIPASTVASESAFSTGERVISDYRSSLASDTVEALICLQDCLRSHESNEDNIAGNLIGGEEEKDSYNLSN